MFYPKIIKDFVIKALMPKGMVPEGLVELFRYSKLYGPIKFNFSMGQDGLWIAESENFRQGVIITSAKNEEALDGKIKDAILTAFDIPSSYAKEARIVREGEKKREYAVA